MRVYTLQVLESFYGLDLNRDAIWGLKYGKEVWVEFMGEQGQSARDAHVIWVVSCGESSECSFFGKGDVI